MSARCSRPLPIATAWEEASPAEMGSEGLWPTATWMSPVLRDSRKPVPDAGIAQTCLDLCRLEVLLLRPRLPGKQMYLLICWRSR
jgi:hypothetical protein